MHPMLWTIEKGVCNLTAIFFFFRELGFKILTKIQPFFLTPADVTVSQLSKFKTNNVMTIAMFAFERWQSYTEAKKMTEKRQEFI